MHGVLVTAPPGKSRAMSCICVFLRFFRLYYLMYLHRTVIKERVNMRKGKKHGKNIEKIF